MNLLKLKNVNNRHYKYALKQEISAAISGNTAPHAWPPNIDLHPLINRYRNKNFFGIESDSEDGWYQFLANSLLPTKLGLSLGSGDARHEKRLTELGLVEEWYAVDLAENPLDTFTETGNNKFLYGDLNFMELPEKKFDIIYCHAFLHHITNLEHLFLQINKSLTDNGTLIVYEYVGENKWQWDEQKYTLLKENVSSKLNNKIPGFDFKRKPLYAMSKRPFESVRSSEIPVLLNNIFEPTFFNHWNRIIYPFLNGLQIPRKYKGKEDIIETFIQHAIELETELIEDKSLLPTELNAIYKKRKDPRVTAVTPWTEDEIKTNLGEINQPIMISIINIGKKVYRKLKKWF